MEKLEKSEREKLEEVLARALGAMDLGECDVYRCLTND